MLSDNSRRTSKSSTRVYAVGTTLRITAKRLIQNTFRSISQIPPEIFKILNDSCHKFSYKKKSESQEYFRKFIFYYFFPMFVLISKKNVTLFLTSVSKSSTCRLFLEFWIKTWYKVQSISYLGLLDEFHCTKPYLKKKIKDPAELLGENLRAMLILG